jgi:hypothetical protein
VRRILSVASIATAAITLSGTPALAQEPLISNLTIVSTTFDPRTGAAFVELSVNCTEEGGLVEFYASLRQGKSQESYDNADYCTGGVATDTVFISEAGDGDRFRAGRAMVNIEAIGYAADSCCETTSIFLNTEVSLTPRK